MFILLVFCLYLLQLIVSCKAPDICAAITVFPVHAPAVFPNFQKFTQHPVFSYSKIPISRGFSNKQNSSLYFLCFRDVEVIIFLLSRNVNSYFLFF